MNIELTSNAPSRSTKMNADQSENFDVERQPNGHLNLTEKNENDKSSHVHDTVMESLNDD
jgi:hypothetical protein